MGADILYERAMFFYLERIFRENLAPGGFLCLGHTESMSRISPLFEVCRYSGAIVYRRPQELRA